MSSHIITRLTKITFIAVFCFGGMANDSFLVAENQKQIIRSIKLPQSDGNYCFCFSANSKKFYTLNQSQGTLRTWDLSSAKYENQLSINRPVEVTHLVPFDEDIIFIANKKGEVWNLNLKQKKLSLLYKPPSDVSDSQYIYSMVFDHKNSELNLFKSNDLVEYLEYQEGQIIKTSRKQIKTDYDKTFTEDRANYATVDENNNVSFFQTNKSKPVWTKKFDTQIRYLSFGPTKDLLIVNHHYGTSRGINTKNGQVNWKISCKPRLFGMHFSKNGEYIYVLVGRVSKTQSKTGFAGFQIHRISDGQLVYKQKLKGDWPASLKVSPDGKFVAALSQGEIFRSEGKIFLWNINFDALEKE